MAFSCFLLTSCSSLVFRGDSTSWSVHTNDSPLGCTIVDISSNVPPHFSLGSYLVSVSLDLEVIVASLGLACGWHLASRPIYIFFFQVAAESHVYLYKIHLLRAKVQIPAVKVFYELDVPTKYFCIIPSHSSHDIPFSGANEKTVISDILWAELWRYS